MKKLLLSILLISFSASTSIASNDDNRLDNEKIKNLISGKRIFLQIPFGGEFPLRYAHNGTVYGDGQAVGLGRLLAPKDKGRWWVESNKLCQKWEKWYDNQMICFILSNVKDDKLTWIRDDGRKGKARIE